jgi:ABC-2 type transport system ATP-binding protein
LHAIPPGQIEDKIRAAVDLLGLEPWLSDEVETLSAGWQRRLALGRVLLSDTPVLLLDEPAAGLDVAARSELLGLVRRLAASGRTLIVSSHILPELQQLADRFAIINQGRWVNAAPNQPFFTRAELQRGFSATRWCVRCNRPGDAVQALASLGLATATENNMLIFPTADDAAAAGILKALIHSGVDVYEFHRRQVELTDLVLQVLQQENQQAGAAAPPARSRA